MLTADSFQALSFCMSHSALCLGNLIRKTGFPLLLLWWDVQTMFRKPHLNSYPQNTIKFLPVSLLCSLSSRILACLGICFLLSGKPHYVNYKHVHTLCVCVVSFFSTSEPNFGWGGSILHFQGDCNILFQKLSLK